MFNVADYLSRMQNIRASSAYSTAKCLSTSLISFVCIFSLCMTWFSTRMIFLNVADTPSVVWESSTEVNSPVSPEAFSEKDNHAQKYASTREYMISVDWTLKQPFKEFKYSNEWINSCLFVIDKHASTNSPRFYLYDIELGKVFLNKNNAHNFDESLDRKGYRSVGCPLFRVVFDTDLSEGLLNQSIPRIVSQVSDTSLLTTSSGLVPLLRTNPSQFIRNRQFYASSLGYSHFLFMDWKNGTLQSSNNHFLKTTGMYLGLRHSKYVLYTDTDSFFQEDVFSEKTEISQYMPEKFLNPLGNIDIVLGTASFSWLNTGVVLIRRSEWVQTFLHQWHSYGRDELSLPYDQLAFWHVLVSSWVQNSSITYTDAIIAPLSEKHIIERDAFLEQNLGVKRDVHKKLYSSAQLLKIGEYRIRKTIFLHIFAQLFNQSFLDPSLPDSNPEFHEPINPGEYPHMYIHPRIQSMEYPHRVFHCFWCSDNSKSFIIHSGGHYAYHMLGKTNIPIN